MNEQVKASVENFLKRFKEADLDIRNVTVAKSYLESINTRLKNLIPAWYIDMLNTYPLVNCELNMPYYDPMEDEDYDSCITVTIADPMDMEEEITNCYPGKLVKSLGYFCIGTDQTGGGDPFFISANEGDNPPVYQIFHDAKIENGQIAKESMIKLADSLADFFDNATLEEC